MSEVGRANRFIGSGGRIGRAGAGAGASSWGGGGSGRGSGGGNGAAAAAGESTSSRGFGRREVTLADVNRMRIADEIKNMPSYADDYARREAGRAGPASTLSAVRARAVDPGLIARQAVDGTNRYRAAKGLPPLRWSDEIAAVALEHAAQMAAGVAPFNHDGFNERSARLPRTGRGASAENLAMNRGVHAVADTAVDGWIKSKGHRENLEGAFILVGIGVAQSPSDGAFYLTQLFVG